MLRRLIIVGLLLLLAISTSAQEAPTFTPTDCEVAIPTFFTAECGTILVPQDRTDPDAGLVELAVMIVNAGDGEPLPDPLVYVPGGPGGAILSSAAAQFPAQFAPLVRTRDLILVDPRGTGRSTPNLYCTEISESFFAVGIIYTVVICAFNKSTIVKFNSVYGPIAHIRNTFEILIAVRRQYLQIFLVLFENLCHTFIYDVSKPNAFFHYPRFVKFSNNPSLETRLLRHLTL